MTPRRLALLALACAALAAEPAAGSAASGVGPPSQGLPDAALREIARLEEGLRATWTGRRLLAETLEVPRRGVPKIEGRSAVAYERGAPPYLAFDLRRLAQTTEWEFELALAREMARASLELPLALVEEEMAARQAAMEFAVEKASATPEFSRRLRQAFRVQQALVESLKPYAALPKAPSGEIEGAALGLALLRRGPDEFYWAVEQGLGWGPEALRLSELEDFLRLHGPQLLGLKDIPEARYVRVEGRRYPAARARAARAILEAGGAARLREALGSFETAGAAALKIKLERWLSRP